MGSTRTLGVIGVHCTIPKGVVAPGKSPPRDPAGTGSGDGTEEFSVPTKTLTYWVRLAFTSTTGGVDLADIAAKRRIGRDASNCFVMGLRGFVRV